MKLMITLEGKSYEVGVEVLPEAPLEPGEDDSSVPIPDSVLMPPLLPDTRDVDKICRCPIAGAIVAVEVTAGMFVHQDTPVATIEAMKMQTVVGAPVQGVVAEVGVKAGDAVRPGQMLCRIE